MDSVNALMAGLVDYAGLFPPAALGMVEAVTNYAEYVNGPDSASLGSFILPVDRIREFDEIAAPLLAGSRPWRLSLLVKDGVTDVIGPEGALLARSAHDRVRVTALEMPFDLFKSLPPEPGTAARSFELFVEVPLADDVSAMLPELAARNAHAKMRTGGVTVGAFPSVYHVVRFLRACCTLGVSFKATAGLHHPLRAEFPLTYDAGSARTTMYGFLNVFLAAAFIWNGADDDVAAKILQTSDPSEIAFTPSGVFCRGNELSTNRLAAARESFARSFGSCSFREPVDELRALLSSTAAA